MITPQRAIKSDGSLWRYQDHADRGTQWPNPYGLWAQYHQRITIPFAWGGKPFGAVTWDLFDMDAWRADARETMLKHYSRQRFARFGIVGFRQFIWAAQKLAGSAVEMLDN